MLKKLVPLFIFALAIQSFAGNSAGVRQGAPEKEMQKQQLRTLVAEMYVDAPAGQNAYVGSRLCMACHEEDAATFYDTQHSMAMIRPMSQYSLTKKKGVLANSLGQSVDDFVAGLDFNKVSSVMDPYKPNAPILSVKYGVYTFTINGVDLPVTFVRQQFDRNGNWIQRYGVKIPVTDQATGKAEATYLAGLQYETKGNKWILDGIEDAYDGNVPKIKPNMTTADVLKCGLESFDQNCVGCHVSGIKSLGKNSKGEVVYKGYTAALVDPDDPNIVDYNGDGFFETVNIGCESCHGPGLSHVIAPNDAARQAAIVNPGNLPQAQQLELCGQCHSRIKSVPNKTYSWPYNETTNQAWNPSLGPMSYFYTLNSSTYPDGLHAKGTHAVFNEALNKSTLHFNNPYQQMNCWTCHTMHRNVATSQTRITMSVKDGSATLRIPTSTKDNTLCLSCHAGHGPFASITKSQVMKFADNRALIESVTEQHTHHPATADRELGSRCISCHMSYKGTIPGTSDYYVAGHTWNVMRPETSLNSAILAKGGQPSSCTVQCHTSRVDAFDIGVEERPATNKWNGDLHKALSSILLKYFGPNGTWWNTTPAAK